MQRSPQLKHRVNLSLFFLPVVSGTSMLAKKMLVVQMLRDRHCLRIRRNRDRGHRRNLLDHDRRVRSVRRRRAPAKRRMPRHQHTRHMQRIQLRKPPHNRVPRINFVIVANLFRRQRLASPEPNRKNNPRASSQNTGSRAAPAPRQSRSANAYAPLRQLQQTPCTKSNVSANPTTASTSLPPSSRRDRQQPNLLASSRHTERR